MGNHFLLLYIYLGVSFITFSQTTCDKASDLVGTINDFHYNAKPIDSSFSEVFSEILIDKSDAHGLFISLENVSTLKIKSFALGDELKNDGCKLFEAFSGMMETGINNSK